MSTEAARNIIGKDSLISNVNLLALVDGSQTALHSHAGGGGGYVDRGDPANYDYLVADFAGLMDNTWRDLDLNGIVGSNVALILIRVGIRDSTIGGTLALRENGNSNTPNKAIVTALVADQIIWQDMWVMCDSAGKIEYRISEVLDNVWLTVAGWILL